MAEEPKKAASDPAKKETFRYDGKDFEYWRTYLRTELKPERRIEALEAIRAFAASGYGKEAVQPFWTWPGCTKGT